MSQASEEELLLHELRNRLNLLGFALHAYRCSGDAGQLDTMDAAYSEAVDLMGQLDRLRRRHPG